MAEQLMGSTCRVQRPSGKPVRGASGDLEQPMETVWEGKCRLRFVSGVTSGVDAAAQLLVKQMAVLSVPIDGTGDLRVNDLVAITASDLDAALVGKQLRITGVHFETQATARRLPVELIS
ncbi:DUF6093 family protein [Curtobacterium sp. MCBD17_003]|uniref:DUF6093 family protein n=1 Tax=Curtobacterium sp. MCBD17_003 TaxID=2175667 RepID=UPI000DA851FB|nr:DUF6093 family protein [Curtobacterium sp. MCBD17_003]WIE56236.1 DUF6093 family protein [Curtobacterium sp. MCBD17_003]